MKSHWVTPPTWRKVQVELERTQRNPKDGEAWGRLGKAYKEALMLRREMRADAGAQEMYPLAVQAYEKIR